MQHRFSVFLPCVFVYFQKVTLRLLDFSYQADKPFILDARKFRLPQFKRDMSKAIQTDKGAILLFIYESRIIEDMAAILENN